MHSGDNSVNGRGPRAWYELEALERRYFLSVGGLDPNFGTGGAIIDERIQPYIYSDVQILIQNDGKILVGGTHDWGEVYIARYNPDGTVDTDFSSDGLFSTSSISQLTAIRLQEDGKIVAAGWGGIERLNPDGSIDQAFGEGGRVLLKQPFSVPNDILILHNGKILVARYRAITHLNSDGTPDVSFGSAGEVAVGGWGDSVVELREVDNGIVALVHEFHRRNLDCYAHCHTPPPSYHLMRFDEQGEADPDFGDGGIALPMTDGMVIENVEVADDGRMVFLGHSLMRDIAVYAYRSDGLPDPQFGTSGLDISAPLDAYDGSMTLAHDGRISIFNWESEEMLNWQSELMVVRLNLDGTVDRTIGRNGTVRTGLKAREGTVVGVEDDRGGLLLAGTFETGDYWNSETHFFLARVLLDLEQTPSQPAGESEQESEDESEEDTGQESSVIVIDGAIELDGEWGWIDGGDFFDDDGVLKLDDGDNSVWV